MSDTVTKRLNVSDTITIPYEANKLWSVTASLFGEYNIIIETASYTASQNKLDYTYSNLLYKSVLANYYPQSYPTFSHSTASYSQTIYWSTNLSTSSYSGFQRLGNARTEFYYPSSSNPTASVCVINIPSSLYSGKVIPTTFEMEISGGKIYDDGEYNLRYSGSNQTSSIGTVISHSSYVGNLFYEQGLGVVTIVPRSMRVNPAPVLTNVTLWTSYTLPSSAPLNFNTLPNSTAAATALCNYWAAGAGKTANGFTARYIGILGVGTYLGTFLSYSTPVANVTAIIGDFNAVTEGINYFIKTNSSGIITEYTLISPYPCAAPARYQTYNIGSGGSTTFQTDINYTKPDGTPGLISLSRGLVDNNFAVTIAIKNGTSPTITPNVIGTSPPTLGGTYAISATVPPPPNWRMFVGTTATIYDINDVYVSGPVTYGAITTITGYIIKGNTNGDGTFRV